MDITSDLVIRKYRKARAFVKLLPYIYIMGYIFGLTLYLALSYEVSAMVDLSLYISPLVVLCSLRFNWLFDLCAWHRTACLLPMVSFATVIIDSYVISFEPIATWYNWAVIFTVSIITVVSAYFVFLHNKD